MSLTLLAQNLLETYAPTATSAATGFPVTRLYDRERKAQWKATSTADQRIAIDAGAPIAAPTAWGVCNHGGVSSAIRLQSSSNGSSWDTRDSATGTPTGEILRVWSPGALTARYWAVLFETNSAAPTAGEVFIGTHQALPGATLELAPRRYVQGFVVRDVAPSGQTWKAQLGPARRGAEYPWKALVGAADAAALRAMYAACGEGLRNILVTDSKTGVTMLAEVRDEALSEEDVRSDRIRTSLELLEVL